MLIGHSMPKVTGISQYAGAGAAGSAWLTSDNGSAAIDGKPARRSRLQWITTAPAIGHYVGIPLDLAAASAIRVVAFLGLKNVPVGTKVMVFGKRTGDAATTDNFTGGNQGSVVQFADGTLGVWIVLPEAAEPVVRIEFRIYNDKAGATWATAATTIDVGELVAMPALEIDIDAGWSQPRIDPSLFNRSRSAQVSTVPVTGYRELSCTYSQAAEAKVRYGGLPGGMDWTRLDAALVAGQRCVVIPRWKTAGAPDPAKANAHAMYGIAVELGEIQHVGGPYWRRAARFQEVPAT